MNPSKADTSSGKTLLNEIYVLRLSIILFIEITFKSWLLMNFKMSLP